mgnify:CR=1 FL=1
MASNLKPSARAITLRWYVWTGLCLLTAAVLFSWFLLEYEAPESWTLCSEMVGSLGLLICAASSEIFRKKDHLAKGWRNGQMPDSPSRWPMPLQTQANQPI